MGKLGQDSKNDRKENKRAGETVMVVKNIICD